MALFTLEELASYLQQDLDTATASLARDVATGLVEGYCRRTWDGTGTEYTKIRRPDSRGRVVLPRKVASVDEVRLVNDDGTPGTVLAGWTFDGIDTVALPTGYQVLNLAESAYDADTVEVTWTSAADTAPAPVQSVALAVAARTYNNATGVRTTAVDDFSITYAGGGSEVGGTGLFSSEKQILGPYRRSAFGSQGIVA